MKNDDFLNQDNVNEEETLSNNSLAFIALCNEYCSALENVAMNSREELIDTMLRLLPRIYITASDLKVDMMTGEGGYIAQTLDEDSYNRIRDIVASQFGEDDTFLEVFVEDMKYSDTPVAATISELLADLFQVFYDFVEACREAPNYLINEALMSVRESFADFWSQTLVNVLRAINSIKYS